MGPRKHQSFTFACRTCGRKVEVKYRDITHKYMFCSRQCSGASIIGENNHQFKGRRKLGEYIVVYQPGHPKAFRDGEVLEHILVAEKAIGHYLPPKAVIHHINEIKNDNHPQNLVICHNDAYHRCVHLRMNRKKELGNPNLKRCSSCRKIKLLSDFPINIKTVDGRGYTCSACYKEVRKNENHYNRQKTHCIQGHPFDETNTYIRPRSGRACIICMRQQGRDYLSRKRQHATI